MDQFTIDLHPVWDTTHSAAMCACRCHTVPTLSSNVCQPLLHCTHTTCMAEMGKVTNFSDLEIKIKSVQKW